MSLRPIIEAFSSWMTAVAGTLVAIVGGVRSPRRVRLVEEADHSFKVETLRGHAHAESSADRLRIVNGAVVGAPPSSLASALRGSRIELVLRSSRFLSRPLELPKRAAEFLDGIVRAQIDRLTPWSAADAAFGWTPPRELARDRISLTMVATARALIAPYLRAVAGLGAEAVVVLAEPQDGNADAAPIKVFEHRMRGALDIERVARVLAAVFIVAGLSAGIAQAVDRFVADDLEAQLQNVSRRISERRVLMRRDGSTGAAPAQRALDRRKWETPSSAIVLEALSQILPDHTYVTELRVEGDKLQVIGITRDAPSLIRLIEQSPLFTRATFFAPTTRSPGDPGERFHIEARIKPVFTLRT